MNTSDLKLLFPKLKTKCFNVSHREHIDLVNSLIEPVDKDSNQDDSDLYKVIFAPDPLTGIPQSDLSLLVKNKYSDDVRRFIDEKGFQQPIIESQRLSVDTDLSLVRDRRKQYGTERLDYINSLRSIALEGLKKPELSSLTDKSE